MQNQQIDKGTPNFIRSHFHSKYINDSKDKLNVSPTEQNEK